VAPRRGEDGNSTTELVLLMPVVLFVVMLIVQTGLYLHARQVVEAAAHEALEAAQGETATQDLGRQAGDTFLAEAGGVRDATVDVTRSGTQVSVSVTATAPNVLPLAVWQVSSSATGEVERFIQEADR
jgi:Flp pilus assembly protein TadG